MGEGVRGRAMRVGRGAGGSTVAMRKPVYPGSSRKLIGGGIAVVCFGLVRFAVLIWGLMWLAVCLPVGRWSDLWCVLNGGAAGWVEVYIVGEVLLWLPAHGQYGLARSDALAGWV